LAVEMKGLLIGESASDAAQDLIVNATNAAPQVTRIIHMRTQHLGPEELLVAMKLEFDPDMSMAQLGPAIDDVERRIRDAEPTARIIYIEPDVFRGESQ
jgi:divalent metal cation (Fe/Co/Zn/Cd) transporter